MLPSSSLVCRVAMNTVLGWVVPAAGFVWVMGGVWIWSDWKHPSWSARYRRYVGGGNAVAGAGAIVQGIDQLLDQQFAWAGWLPAVLLLAGAVLMLYWNFRHAQGGR